ncbi:MAG: PfkB family carbohydrate kinase [Acidobacteriota bacterium]|nr:PfkB family carbohydrate kinase [Acidobacteriota bacterium]
MSLIVIGSLAFDTIETPCERRERIVGGSGTYCSLAASYFTRPRVVSVVGRDFPERFLEFLRKRGVDLRGVQVKPGKTFHWEGLYGEDPNQRTTVKTELNVFGRFKPVLPASSRRADIVYLANIDPELHESILAQTGRPKIIAMDTIRFWIQNKRQALLKEIGRADIFFANDEEVRMLADGETNLIRAAKKLLNLGPKLLIVKKGEHGALILNKNFVFGVLAHPCEAVVDPTGAGDCFAGGFLGYLDKIQKFTPAEFRRATVFGSIMASFAIEDFGIGRFETLSMAEIDKRFKDFKRLVSF